jgi:hypothetical protein
VSLQKALVDTSAWIETLRRDGDQTVRQMVVELTTEGSVVLCDMVLLELWNGAQGSSEHRMLRDLSRELEVVPTTSEVWELATDFALKSRRNGLTIPATDLLVAACARYHNLRIVHVDRHFDALIPILESE